MDIDTRVNYFGQVLGYYMHQNSLMWGRLNHCLTVQIVSIGGAYAVKSMYFTPTLLLLGAFISITLILMFNRDRQIRDAHAILVRELAASIDKETGEDIGSVFWIKIPPKGWAPIEAGKIFRWVLGLVVIFEFVLAIALIVQPSMLK